ncbi:hypothetical protein C9422_02430 [Pseudomonas sp. B1(2018)]|nr:hypothetical protein C9422_02430 [Pseudomonas sp. B1(2018)]
MGASLLAMAAYQSTSLLNVMASSRASSLPQVSRPATKLVINPDHQCSKEQILLSDVIGAIASASLVAQFSVIASEGLRTSCHRLRSASLCGAFGRWINSATAYGYSLP